MISLTQLEYLVALDKTRHFGRAAAMCHVSQPSLSAQIQKAEQDLGHMIFDRSKKPILLTQKGKELLKMARSILKECKRMYELSDPDEDPAGPFHLGVIPTLSSSLLPLFVESFSKKYPKIELTVSEFQTQDLLQKLYDDELDAGLLVTPLKDDQIIERTLFYEPFYIFISQEHPLSQRKKVSDDELVGQGVWLLDEGHCFRDQVIKVCSLDKQTKVLPNVSFRSGSLETLLNLVRRGEGLTLIPFLSTLHLTETDRNLHLKRFQNPVPTREVSLVHARAFLKEDIIEAIVQEVIDSLPEEVLSYKKKNFEIIDL